VEDCIFCKVVDGDLPAEIVYQDDHLVAFRDIQPQAPVHILIIPRKHIATLLETGESDMELLGRLQATAIQLAREEGLEDTGFRLVTNTLTQAGQSVFHVHLHLLGGRTFSWPPG
jgi:histidine triad (HIT) family protein